MASGKLDTVKGPLFKTCRLNTDKWIIIFTRYGISTVNRCDGQTCSLLLQLGYVATKYYWNWIISSQLLTKLKGDVFFETQCTSYQWRQCCKENKPIKFYSKWLTLRTYRRHSGYILIPVVQFSPNLHSAHPLIVPYFHGLSSFSAHIWRDAFMWPGLTSASEHEFCKVAAVTRRGARVWNQPWRPAREETRVGKRYIASYLFL